MFDAFQPTAMPATSANYVSLPTYLSGMMIGDSARVPAPAYRRVQGRLGSSEGAAKALVQGYLGVTVARDGDWSGGL
jgi:hypothetical protein